MEKIYGAQCAQNGVVMVSWSHFTLFFGYGEDDGNGYNYRHVFTHKPSLQECKDVIVGMIRERVQNTILSGLKYKGSMVWLSAENQRNYDAYASLGEVPVTVKLGTDDEPVFYTFEDADELKEFYALTVRHIRDAIAEGWREIQAIDWSEYENMIE